MMVGSKEGGAKSKECETTCLLLDASCSTVHAATQAEALARWDIKQTNAEDVQTFYKAAPGGVRTTEAFSQSITHSSRNRSPDNRKLGASWEASMVPAAAAMWQRSHWSRTRS